MLLKPIASFTRVFLMSEAQTTTYRNIYVMTTDKLCMVSPSCLRPEIRLQQRTEPSSAYTNTVAQIGVYV